MGVVNSKEGYHPDDGNDKIQFDDKTGIYTMKGNTIMSLIGIGNEHIHEKDLNVGEINRLKEQAWKTTLSDYDMDLLYQYAIKKYKFGGDKKQFRGTALKDIFKGLDASKIRINDLMMAASKPVEAFCTAEGESEEPFCNDNNWVLRTTMIVLYVVMLILVMLIFYKYFKNVL